MRSTVDCQGRVKNAGGDFFPRHNDRVVPARFGNGQSHAFPIAAVLRAFLLPMRFCVPIIVHCVNITMVWQRTLRSSLSTQVRKEIRAHRLFACSAAGPALKEQQRLTRSIARSTRRTNQTRTAFGTRVAVPRHLTPRHCDNPDLRHSETCRTAYCACV